MRLSPTWVANTDAVLGADQLWRSGNRLLFADTASGEQFATLFCIASNDGSVVWHRRLPEPGRAIVGAVVSGLALFFRSDLTEGHLRAYAVENGELAWQDVEMRSGGAMVCDDSALIMDVWSQGREYIALVEGTTGRVLWRVPTVTARWPRSQARRLAFEVQDDEDGRSGVVAAREVSDGSERWIVDLGQEGNYSDIVTGENRNGLVVDVVASEERVYCAVKQGLLLALDASNGRSVWKRKFEGGTPQRPIVHRGRLYTTTMGHFHSLEAATGAILVDEPVKIGALPFGLGCIDGSYYYCSTGNAVLAIDVQTGREVWRYETDDAFGAPLAFEGHVYASGTSGKVYSFAAK